MLLLSHIPAWYKHTHTHLQFENTLVFFYFFWSTVHFPWHEMWCINKVLLAYMLYVFLQKESENMVRHSAALPWHFIEPLLKHNKKKSIVCTVCQNVIPLSVSFLWCLLLCDLVWLSDTLLTLTNTPSVVYRLVQSYINYGWVVPFEKNLTDLLMPNELQGVQNITEVSSQKDQVKSRYPKVKWRNMTKQEVEEKVCHTFLNGTIWDDYSVYWLDPVYTSLIQSPSTCTSVVCLRF